MKYISISEASKLWGITERRVQQMCKSGEFDMTVFDMVMLGRYSHQKMFRNDKATDRKIVRKYLKEVGMEGYEDRSLQYYFLFTI